MTKMSNIEKQSFLMKMQGKNNSSKARNVDFSFKLRSKREKFSDDLLDRNWAIIWKIGRWKKQTVQINRLDNMIEFTSKGIWKLKKITELDLTIWKLLIYIFVSKTYTNIYLNKTIRSWFSEFEGKILFHYLRGWEIGN